MLARAVEPPLDCFYIREYQLGVDNPHIADGIDAAVNVDDVLILKTAHHMHNGVHLSDMRQELVAQPLTLRRAFDQTRYIDELNHRRCVFFGLIHLCQHIQPAVGDGDNAHVGFDSAERIVRRLRARGGNGVEQRAFAHVGQSDNAEFHVC